MTMTSKVRCSRGLLLRFFQLKPCLHPRIIIDYTVFISFSEKNKTKKTKELEKLLSPFTAFCLRKIKIFWYFESPCVNFERVALDFKIQIK